MEILGPEELVRIDLYVKQHVDDEKIYLGGRNTAGLGGKGGPHGLYTDHDVHICVCVMKLL